MSLDEELLEIVAQDGSMDYDKWPGMLEPLIERLDQIVRNEFPIPKVPQEVASSFSSYPIQDSTSLQSSNKENAPPNQQLYSSTASSVEPSSDRVPDSQPSNRDPSDDTLPPLLLSLLSSIRSTLKSYFTLRPPHTIQRLAELILHPTRQYRTLPAYLRAVDRVVSVSSSADIFPLPRTGPFGERDLSNGIVNGISTSFMITDDSLGSDESLGGALLTPIPWLASTGLEAGSAESTAEESISTRESGAVTQGELIRQEQQAGVVITAHPHQFSTTSTEVVTGESHTSPPPEEIPHARGPSVVGVKDMGLQDGRGVEMSLSNSNATQEDADSESAAGKLSETFDAKNSTSNRDADGDGDIVLDDQEAELKEAQPESQQSSETGATTD